MDEPILIASVVCPGCGVPVESGAIQCPKCGIVLAESRESSTVPRLAPAAHASKSAGRSVIDNRAQLLLLLFGAALVLGLPLLWYSRAYGLVGKLVITLLVVLWTIVLLALCWWSLTWSMERLRQIPW